MYISLPDRNDLPEGLRALVESLPDPSGDKSIRALAHSPEHAEKYFDFYLGLWSGTVLRPRLREAVRIAIAETTHCPICAAYRRPDGTADGLTEEDIEHLRDPDYPGFSPKDRAAIRFAHMFGEDHDSIGEDEFVALHEHMSEQEIIELAMLCAQWLGFGRMVKALDLIDQACPIVRPAETAATVA
jgi:AhpD family alkylhydroperoxidase